MVIGLGMMFAVRQYFTTSPAAQPEPWWVADSLKMAYLAAFFIVGPLVTVWSGAQWAVYNWKNRNTQKKL